MTEKMHEAICYAGKRHAGQVRKCTQLPYLVHPMEVMAILIENGCPEEAVIAGILHDVIEDTCDNNDTIRGIVREEIRARFGDAVLAIVNAESEDKSKSWRERKEATVFALAEESVEVQLVCCADKLSNVLSIKADREKSGERVFSRFNAPKDELSWYYRSIAENLTKLEGFKMLEELKEAVRAVFG